jgi:SAM-dependent MidA family methyltransferase
MTASDAHSILPLLSPDEERHSNAAVALIRDAIVAAEGWISFEKYMELALYAPSVGYYSAGSVKIGASGDFVTAPEVSDLFSRCVARQCADVLSETGGDILELGAGTGRMAVTILEALTERGVLPDRYAILEVSADLADRQRTRIQQLPLELRNRVVWLDRLPDQPMPGVILANEVLDALPFQRFTLSAGTPHELGVALNGNSFVWQEQPPSANSPAALIRDLPQPLPDGYTSELCPLITPWIDAVGRCLSRGLLLLFDYGLPRAHYYHPQRTDGTLQCHFKQRAHDNPFINVAVQDITAWVDFTHVAEAALAVDLEVTGFATQAAFLLATGIESMAASEDPITQVRLAGEARRLLLPSEMGESFKAMALARNLQQSLKGFAYQDLRASL